VRRFSNHPNAISPTKIQANIPWKSMDVKVFALVFLFSLSKTHKVG
jgi:hypothetical protein